MDIMEVMFWLAQLQQANEDNETGAEAREMIRQENEMRAKEGQPSVQEELAEKAQLTMHPYINPDPNEKDLNKLLMSDGKETAQEWLMTQPERWRSLATEAIYECLKKGWPLHEGNIQMTAREIDAKRNPKGW